MNYDNYQNYSLPTIRNEDWKYTDLSHLAKQGFSLIKNAAIQPTADAIKRVNAYIKQFCVDSETIIVILDGVLQPDLSKSKDFKIAASYNFREFYLSQASGQQIGISEFVNNADHHGIVIELNEIKGKTKLNIRLLNVFTERSQDKIINNKHFIRLDKNSELTLLEEYLSISDGMENEIAMNCNVLFEFDLLENSVLNHYILQSHNESTYHVASYIINQQAHSQYNNYNLSFGGKLSRQDIVVYKNGDATNTALRGLFMPRDKQHMDSHLKIYHNDSHGTSLQDYRGVLKDRGHGVWNGMVYVAPNTKANTAIQSNKNLLLSSNAMIDAKPELQIYSDDVSCAHGATIGRLDEKAMFYLQSRGVPAVEAKTMLISAFVDHIISTVTNQGAADWLEQVLASRIAMENVNV